MITRHSDHQAELREHMRGGEGTAKLTALSKELPGNMRLYSMITLEPGCGIGEHQHDNETELFYFIEGNATVTDDGVEYVLEPGDVLSTANGHRHSVMNNGTDTLNFLACIIKD